MSNNKQSSVRWAIEELVRFELGTSEFFSKTAIINHADRLHKEEMEHFFKRGMFLVEGRLWKPIDKFEEYYNETFGGNNEQQ